MADEEKNEVVNSNRYQRIEENIPNNNKLILMLTDFGTQRIAEAVSEPTVNLNITKIRIGSGDDGRYYKPDSSQTSLKGDLGYEFYIYDKALLEDGLTISFHTIIPEDISGFDIREVGLYETYMGEDRLFAISTQQPFVKPSFEDNYFINIDYYIFLRATNFANVYDQITLDVQHAVVTEPDLEELMQTFLFAQGNLINQIGNNSTIIGYDRATQLYEKIEANKKTYSYITLYKNFASLIDNITSIDKIFSYWVFDYSRREEISNSVVDLSNNGYYLTTNKPLTNYEKVYKGFTSMFSFNTPNYYRLSSQFLLNLYNPTTNMDLPFSMMFVVEPLMANSTRTLIAKSDYAMGIHTLEVQELPDRSLQIKLFSSSESYLTFKTVQSSIPVGAHSIVTSYNPAEREMTIYINSNKYVVKAIETTEPYTHINEVAAVYYAYDCAPSYYIYASRDENDNPTKLFVKDQYNNLVGYQGTDWTIENNTIYYKGNEAEFNPDIPSETLPQLYGWIPSQSGGLTPPVVYTKELPEDTENPIFDYRPVLYTNDYIEYTGTDYRVDEIPETETYKIVYYGGETPEDAKYDTNYDIPLQGESPITAYNYKYIMNIATIYTNSTSDPSVLYEKDEDNNFTVYEGDEWTIANNEIYRLNQLATYNADEDVILAGVDLTSYIVSSDGSYIDNVNSNVGLISIIREGLSDESARILALNLCAALGRNPYLGGI